jgi:S1-C subfamily serine protease
MTLSTTETTSPLLGLSNDLAGAVQKAGGAVVAVNARQRIPSSGIHWSPGVIVTSDHTVERDEEITVTLADGRTVPATLAGRDPSTDIAILKVQGVEASTADIGDSSALAVGQMVLAVGRPGEHGLSASYGVISALSGNWSTYRGGQIDQFVRPDLTFYPGFSGGPLVDARGQIVGMNTSGLTRGLGVTVPASTVNRVADQLLSKGRIARGYLGLGFQPVHLPDSLKNTLSLTSNGGLIVVTVEQGGPAEQAGMFIGDVLVALDNTPITDIDAVQSMLGSDRVGKAITARVVRGGVLADVAITVAERPQRGE